MYYRYNAMHDDKFDRMMRYGDTREVLTVRFVQCQMGKGSYEEVLHDLQKNSYGWENKKGRIKPDFVHFKTFNLTCRKSAFEKIEKSKLHAPTMAFPFMISDEHYVTLRPTVHLDLFDLEKSRYRTYSSGAVGLVKEVVLTSPPPTYLDLFSLSGGNSLMGVNLVSERFVEFCEAEKFSGMRFTPISIG